jgi:GT2 family glycosyltransferase
MKIPPTVSIIIVNYNAGELLFKTVSSIITCSYPKNKLEIILIDNASKDKSIQITLDKLQNKLNEIKKFTIIKNKYNKGWCSAINEGLKLAQGDIIIFSNHDVVYHKDSIHKIVSYFINNKNIGICQFFSFLPSGEPDVAACYLDPLGYAYNFLSNNPVFVSFGEAVAIAVKKEVIEKIGALDEDYFIEYEDQDFCWRALLAGYKILFCPEAIVYHYRGSVQKPIYFLREKRVMLYTKNHIATLIKNLEIKNLLLYLPLVFTIEMGKAMYILVYKRNLKLFIGILDGILAFLLNLRSLISKRQIVQTNVRKVSDKEVFNYFVPFMLRHQLNYLKYQEQGKRYLILDNSLLSKDINYRK